MRHWLPLSLTFLLAAPAFADNDKAKGGPPAETPSGTHVRILHMWDGPGVPMVGGAAATLVIGPVFVHGIASRTLAGLAAHAERGAT